MAEIKKIVDEEVQNFNFFSHFIETPASFSNTIQC